MEENTGKSGEDGEEERIKGVRRQMKEIERERGKTTIAMNNEMSEGNNTS